MTIWPSGLRRQFKALFRKGEGSNPSVVTIFFFLKCILCKDANNGFEHVVNECKCLEEERKELINKLQYINNTWGTNLLREIEYHYYNVRYSNAESLAKRDNKGISLIKKFIRIMYLKLGKAKKDNAE